MKLLLVKCEDNWADEFDLQGFAIYTDAAWKEYLQLVEKKIFYKARSMDDEYGAHVAEVGTNQSRPYENFKSFKKVFTTKTITEEEAKGLCSLFKLKIVTKAMDVPVSYGMFMYLSPSYEEDEEE
jgi:deoxyribodipyrimidine photolyase